MTGSFGRNKQMRLNVMHSQSKICNNYNISGKTVLGSGFVRAFFVNFWPKRGRKEYCLTLSSLQQLLKILITKTCHKFSRNSNGVNFFVTCDLSYEHSCDLCSELQGRYSGHSLRVLGCFWKDSVSPTDLFLHHQWQEMVHGLKGNEVHPLPPVLQEVLDG